MVLLSDDHRSLKKSIEFRDSWGLRSFLDQNCAERGEPSMKPLILALE